MLVSINCLRMNSRVLVEDLKKGRSIHAFGTFLQATFEVTKPCFPLKSANAYFYHECRLTRSKNKAFTKPFFENSPKKCCNKQHSSLQITQFNTNSRKHYLKHYVLAMVFRTSFVKKGIRT